LNFCDPLVENPAIPKDREKKINTIDKKRVESIA